MAALCTSVISLWLCTPAATSSPGLWCLPWMCLQPEPGAHGGAPDQRERSLLVRRPSRADAQDEATQGRGSKSRLLCTSTQGRLPSYARILLHTHAHTRRLWLVSDTGSLCCGLRLLSQGRAADIVRGSSVVAIWGPTHSLNKHCARLLLCVARKALMLFVCLCVFPLQICPDG